MKRPFIFTLVVLGCALPTAARGQEWMPLATEVFTQMTWARASLRETWRGIEYGSAAAQAGAAASWGGPGVGTNALALFALGETGLARRTSLSDRIRAGATVSHQVDDDDSRLWAGIEGSALPSADSSAATAEVSVGTKVRVPYWLPERHPFLIVEAAEDLVRYKAAYVRSALRLDYKFMPTAGAFIEGGWAWSGLSGGTRTGSVPFSSHGGDVMLTLVMQTDPATLSYGQWTKSVEPYVRGLWIARNGDPNRFDAGIRFTLVR